MRAPLVALFALLALALGGGTSRAATSTQLTVSPAAIEARASSATVAWRTSRAARVVIEFGLDDHYGVWSSPTGPGTSGRALLAGLEPATTYRYRLIATVAGQRAESVGSFTTGARPPWTVATTTKNALLLDSQPFFPRMVFRQCPWAFPASLAAGINVFMGSCDGSGHAQLGTLAGRAFSVLDASQHGIDGRGMIGWHQLDEADLWVTPDRLPVLPSSKQSRRVSFLTLSSHFSRFAAPGPLPRSQYPAMIARAEMIGFDVYPLSIWCRRIFSPTHVMQRELVELAAGKPTFQWIEAAVMGDSPCPGDWRFEPWPDTVRAEVWLAIAGGARGIGYFPDYWRPNIAAEITRTNRQIAALAPALLADEVAVDVPAKSPILAGGRAYNGAVYVIAVNSTVKTWRKSVTVPGLKATRVRVWGENRELPVQRGKITDTFAPLAARVYVAPPAGV